MVVETRRRKASASVKQLPQDVLNDILSRLPIKDLLRYRCVSKSWLLLLSYDPHFNKLHSDRILHDNKRPGIVALHQMPRKLYCALDYTLCDKAIKFDIPLNKFDSFAREVYSILGICNGLICLIFHSIPFIDHNSTNVYVWNPLTSHHITIPCPPVPSKFRYCYYSFGFGFDEVKDECKVIRSIWTRRRVCPRIDIYTLGADSWRTLKEIPYDSDVYDSHVPFVNGALHWIASNLASPSLGIILSFDVKDECFQDIPLPTGVLDADPTYLSMRELDGQLSVLRSGGSQNVQLWVMKVYAVEGSWVKQCEIELQNAPYLSFGGFQPLGLASDGQIIAYSRMGMSLYSSENSSITELKPFQFEVCVYVHGVFTYHGRLTSLKSHHEFSERKMPRKRIRKTELRGT